MMGVGGGQEQLTQELFNHIPVGVGSQGIIPTDRNALECALEMGMDWSLREGYAWAEDKEHCEEYGRMLGATPAHCHHCIAVPVPSASILRYGIAKIKKPLLIFVK